MRNTILLGIAGLTLLACSIPAPKDADTVAIRNEAGKPFLGVAFRKRELDAYGRPGHFGYQLTRVLPNSAAARAQLRENDIILRYDGRQVGSEDREAVFSDYLAQQKRIGNTLELSILRPQTKIAGYLNGKPLRLDSSADIVPLLQQVEPIGELRLRLNAKPVQQDFIVTLGSRRGRLHITDRAEVFDQYGGGPHPVSDLSGLLLESGELNPALELWRSAQDDGDYWADGEHLALVTYLRRRPLRIDPLLESVGSRLLMLAENEQFAELLEAVDQLGDISAPRPSPASLPAATPEALLQLVMAAGEARGRAISKYSEAEQNWLRSTLPKLLSYLQYSYDIGTGRSQEEQARNQRALQLAARFDRAAMSTALKLLLPIADRDWLRRFAEQMAQRKILDRRVQGVQGSLLYVADTPYGRVVVGGPGNNVYRGEFALIADTGGDDAYQHRDGRKGVSVLLDLGGDDRYSHQRDVTQGAAVLGVSLLVDLGGDDVYTAANLAQGSAVLGEALLLDYRGKDRYSAASMAQGSAFFGKALLLDLGGDDEYRGDHFVQGVGGSLGIGMLVDTAGNDRYLCGGKHSSSYRTSGIFRGSCQGFGIGFRFYAPGGVGGLLEGAGDDLLEAGNFAQGTGYFHGLGWLHDRGNGADTYHASRYGLGAAAHYGIGVALTAGGDDRYHSSFGGVILGAAWDHSIALFRDRDGDDRYGHWPLHFSQGSAAHAGFGLFTDEAGDDRHLATTAGRVWAQKDELTNLSLLLDLGGSDFYAQTPLPGDGSLRRDDSGYGLWVDLPAGSLQQLSGEKLTRWLEANNL